MNVPPDDRVLPSDVVCADQTFPIVGLAASRDPGAAPLTQYPAAEVTQAADIQQLRSADICRAVWRLAERAECPGDR